MVEIMISSENFENGKMINGVINNIENDAAMAKIDEKEPTNDRLFQTNTNKSPFPNKQTQVFLISVKSSLSPNIIFPWG